MSKHMNFADRIKPVAETSHSGGIKLLVYGPSGAGKTVLSTTTPNPSKTLVISAERGLLSIRESAVQSVEVKGLQDMRDAHAWLLAGKHDFEWVVLDSISEIGEVVLDDLKDKFKADGRKAYGELGDVSLKLIKSFRDLPMHVLFIAKQETYDDDGTLKYRPSFPGKRVTEQLPYFFDEVFAYRHIRRVTESGEEEVKRALLTTSDGRYDAKDRSGSLPRWVKPDLADILNQIQNPAAQAA